MVYITPKFLVLQFGENFMKTIQKYPSYRYEMHENLHKNVNENMFSFTFLCKIFMSFYDGQLKQQIFYSFTLLISHMVFNPFQMTVQFF